MSVLRKYLKRNLVLIILLIASHVASIFFQIRKAALAAQVLSWVSYSPEADTVSSTLTYYGIRLLLVALGMAAACILIGVFAFFIATNIARDMRNDLYDHIMTFSMVEMNRFSIPSVISRCSNDISTLETFLQQFLTGALAAPFLIIGGLISVFQAESSMTWILAAGVAAVLLLFWIMISRMMPVVRRMFTYLDLLQRDSRESLSGIQILKALNREAWSASRISGAAQDLRATNERYSFIEAVILPSMYLVLNVLNLVVIWVGAANVSSSLIDAGTVFAFINYMYMVVSGVISACIIGLQMPRVSVCLKRVNELFDTVSVIWDPASPQPLPDTFDVTFDNVSFRYEEEGGDVVRHISFTARQGQITGIIGNTGCGKTTLMEMIPRMYDPREGRVLIGGVDVRNFSLPELRNAVGSVPQNARLFTGTILSNIAMRDPAAEQSAVERAAELSQSASFIRDKQEGFDSFIAQGGSNVSGGQRQRLTIARALCSEPRILILDDASSALDYETDVALRESIRNNEKEAAVIIVSQRISSIRRADQIIVMRDGEIMGIGSHEELKAACPVYQEILRSQMEAAS